MKQQVFRQATQTAASALNIQGFLPRPVGREQDNRLFSGSHPAIPVSCGARARRKPLLKLRLSGCQLLRYAERQFCAVLFQLPPRWTRFVPYGD